MEDGTFLSKSLIFGSPEEVEKHATTSVGVNVAQPGWQCFCQVSEEDYLFVCVDEADKKLYTSTRVFTKLGHGLYEDHPHTVAPFIHFIDNLERFMDVWVTYHDTQDGQQTSRKMSKEGTPCYLEHVNVTHG